MPIPAGAAAQPVTEPLDVLMPTMWRLGARWTGADEQWRLEALVEHADEQDELSTRDKQDVQRIPPGGTPGYTVVNLRSEWRAAPQLTLSLAIDNLFNQDYRIHGSGLNEPGRNLDRQRGAAALTMDAPYDPGVKLRHIEACLTQPVEYRKPTGFADYEFENEALPELSLATLDLSAAIAGRALRAPLMIAPMTGGTRRGLEINRRLAAVAEEFGLAFGVGSQRIALEREECAAYFRVRDVAPHVPLFANLGAAQLAAGYGADDARRAVAMIGADALFVHLNPMQEAVKGGDRDFRNVGARLAQVCRALESDEIPVFAREVGFGMTTTTAARLVDCGVAGIDCSGAGGTSWAKVEAFCATDERLRALGERFGEWGIPTSRVDPERAPRRAGHSAGRLGRTAQWRGPRQGDRARRGPRRDGAAVPAARGGGRGRAAQLRAGHPRRIAHLHVRDGVGPSHGPARQVAAGDAGCDRGGAA